jgi:hypothetical protein
LPQKLTRLARPEFIGMLDRLPIHTPILREIFNPRLLRELFPRLENALLFEMRFDVPVVDLHN